MRLRIVRIGLLLTLLISSQILAQNGNDLFQQALARQTATGDMPGAIQIYERILRDFSTDRPLVAKALVQLGKAYESLGEAKSRDYFEQVVSKYADQADMVAEANARLKAITKVDTPVEVATPNTRAPLNFAISPDGRSIVFPAPAAGRPTLWLHNLETGKAAPIAGAELVVNTGNIGPLPFWSPDSKSIAFFSDGKLKRIDVQGGTAQLLADVPQPAGGAWSRDGIIVFASGNGSGLRRVPADGGGPATRVGTGDARCPQFLPDGRHFLFYQGSDASGRGQVAQVLWIGSLDSPERKALSVQAFAGGFAAPDQLLYTTERGLLAQRLDLATFELTGSSVRISEQIGTVPASCLLGASASASGVLAYRMSAPAVPERQLVWLDRQGQQTGSFLRDPSNPTLHGFRPTVELWHLGETGVAHPQVACG